MNRFSVEHIVKDMSGRRASEADIARWSGKAALYLKEGHTGVADLLGELLDALYFERELVAEIVIRESDVWPDDGWV